MDQGTTARQIPTVELGGRFWELRMSHRAMRRFCSLVHCKMSNFSNALDDYDNHAKLIWTTIWAQDEKVTLDDVNRWLDELPTMGDVIRLATDIITAAMPDRGELPEGSEEGSDEGPLEETTSI